HPLSLACWFMTQATTDLSATLKMAVAEVALVRVNRSIRRADRLEGFAIAIGAGWFLLHKLSPDMFLDGHVALRIRDVRTITFLGGASFQARALEHYGDRAR